MKDLIARYTPEQREVILAYWDVIRWTRQTGKISENIKKTELEYWAQYDADVVAEALRIHMDKYANIREHYTRGIMRNLAVDKSVGNAKRHTAAGGDDKVGSPRKSRFINYQQRNDTDYEALEYLERLEAAGELDEMREKLKESPRFARYL